MIPTFSDADARAPRRRPWRLLAAGVLATLLALSPTMTASAGTVVPVAAAESETPAPADDAPADRDARLVLAPTANGVVRPGQPFVAAVELTNGTSQAIPATRVSLRLGGASITDRGALAGWLTGEGDPALPEVGAVDLDAVSAGGDSAATVELGPDDPNLAGRAPGVYPLQATVVVADEEITAVSILIVNDDGAAPTPVGVIVPITAAPRAAGLLTADELTELTAADGALTAQLDAVEGTTAILAVDPAVPAAIRVLGTAVPPVAEDWLLRLESLSNSRFALQFGDADVAAQVQAGLPAPLQPTSLQAYMDPADFQRPVRALPTSSPTPSATASASPSPSATPDGPVFPDLAALTDIGEPTRDGVFWPASGRVTAGTLPALAAQGSGGLPALTLLASDGTATGSPDATVAGRASADGAELLVYDVAVSRALDVAAREDDPTTRAAALTAATAQLALVTAQAPGRPFVVVLERAEDRPRAALRAAVTTATGTPGLAPVTLDDLAASAPGTTTVIAAEPDPALSADVTLLMGDEARLTEFATIMDDPQLLTGPERAEILQLLGVGWESDRDASHAAIGAHRAETAATLQSVGILSTNVILASYGSDGFRPYVRNDLGYPVNLVFVAHPDDSSVDVAERTEVRAQADSNTRVNLPIEARIANATAVVTMQLYSPTGVAIGAVESATVEVHAEWETIGLVALVAIMAIFLTGGVVRTVLRRRARRREQETLTLEPDVSTGSAEGVGAGSDAPSARGDGG
jgi:hypothetical protein